MQVSNVVTYADKLEKAKFVEFWALAKIGRNSLLDPIVGFDNSIRTYISSVLPNTFRKIGVRILSILRSDGHFFLKTSLLLTVSLFQID